MTLQSYQYGFLERLWLKLEARSADKNTENIITILPVVLFMQKEQLDTLLEKLPTILTHYLKPHLIQRVFSHIVIKLKSYAKNEQLFMQERGDALELIATNIQLYALVLDLDYQLNKENLRLLTYQEKYCVDKTLNKTRAKPNSTKL